MRFHQNVVNHASHWEKMREDPSYQDWEDNHQCRINHTGSSGAMESVAAIRMFKRSIDFNKLRYTSYLGDGDTKLFAVNPYPGIKINKLEGMGHVQKTCWEPTSILEIKF